MLLNYIREIAFGAAIILGLVGIVLLFERGNGFFGKLFGIICLLICIAFAYVLKFFF